MLLTPYIYGLHDPGGEHLMVDAGTPGWIVFTQAIGCDPNDMSGHDYTHWVQQGIEPIVRLNNGYEPAGTIPDPSRYLQFAQRCGNYATNSSGAHFWIIGNEPNYRDVEGPDRQPILPVEYARCYEMCRSAIRHQVGHRFDQVLTAPIAPWNATTTYTGNEKGDWVQYFVDMLTVISELTTIDGIALHTYTHGPDPGLITANTRMSHPFEHRHYDFRAYWDFIYAIPDNIAAPVYITETDQNDPWLDQDTGWVEAAYREINEYNWGHDRKVRCLCLYRWQPHDQWVISGKDGVIRDFQRAMGHKFVWTGWSQPEAKALVPKGTLREWYTEAEDISRRAHQLADMIKVFYDNA